MAFPYSTIQVLLLGYSFSTWLTLPGFEQFPPPDLEIVSLFSVIKIEGLVQKVLMLQTHTFCGAKSATAKDMLHDRFLSGFQKHSLFLAAGI